MADAAPVPEREALAFMAQLCDAAERLMHAQILHVEDVARLLQMTEEQVRYYMTGARPHQRLAYSRMGEAVVFKLQDVLTFVDKHRHDPDAGLSAALRRAANAKGRTRRRA